jgi:methionyl-tRNA synthetase
MSKQNHHRRPTERPTFPKRAVVTCGMPYGNKQLHFGHIGGVFIHADVFARFLRDRIGPENVIFVSGTDCYGSPIVEYHRNKVNSGEYVGDLQSFVQENHQHQSKTLQDYHIDIDLFASSAFNRSGEIHKEFSSLFYNTLKENGHLHNLSSLQFYDVKLDCFLNGRQVIGQCPIQDCQSERGYADECSLGHQYMPKELRNPKSSLSGASPELRSIDNWYIDLAAFSTELNEWVGTIESNRRHRKFVVSSIKEFFLPPIVHVVKKFSEELDAISTQLPSHTQIEGKGKSLQLHFSNLSDREKACSLLSSQGIQFRTGKTLVPFRLTGNIEWGIPVPNSPDLTFWVWPESLWAPISFTATHLEATGQDKEDWKKWWCSSDSKVFQFIGEDNVYFYGPAEMALLYGMQGKEFTSNPNDGQFQTPELIVNKHLLFLNTKASSSGKVKPPLAHELLEHYTAEQLRAHFISLGLGMKNISFAPKPFNPKTGPKDADPALKEAQLFSNIYNRVARNCFYTAQKFYSNKIPIGIVSPDVIEDAKRTILGYERAMESKTFHQAFGAVDKFIRKANKQWSSSTKGIDWNDPGNEIEQPLIDAFHMLRVATVLMHPIAPIGTEKILYHLNLNDDFWDWTHIFEPISYFMRDKTHQLNPVPAKTDFFERHPSQWSK